MSARTPLFVFGTLMDEDVWRAVVGRPRPSGRVRPARLRGFARLRVSDRSYPMLVRRADACVDGLLVTGLDGRTLALLDRYEGRGYRRASVSVETREGALEAQVYLTRPGAPMRPDPRPWDLEDWRRREKRRFLACGEAGA